MDITSDSLVKEIPENIFTSSRRDYEDQLPLLEFYSVEKAGHNPWIDQPEKTTELLRKLLRRF